MENPIAEKELNTYKIKIYQDNNPMNPRQEWENFGNMICFHRRYKKLGDEDNYYNSSDYSDWDDMEKAIIKQEKAVIILPLYLYDHSGITMSTTPFTCSWDSGQIGFIYVTKADILKEFKCKKITKQLKDRMTEILQSEVKIYDKYLTGEVYGYVIEDVRGKVVDSCWGFFEDPKNIIIECENIVSQYDYQLQLGV